MVRRGHLSRPPAYPAVARLESPACRMGSLVSLAPDRRAPFGIIRLTSPAGIQTHALVLPTPGLFVFQSRANG